VLSGRLWKQRLGWLHPDVVFAPLPVLVVIGAVELAAIIFGQGSFAVSQAGEDGSFYVAIAHNMATGKGITFDGVTPTASGHWAWLLLLAVGALALEAVDCHNRPPYQGGARYQYEKRYRS
jgi:hypothetical protein